MDLLLAIVLAGVASTGVEYRALDPEEPFRPLDRTAVLYGSVEFRAQPVDGVDARGLRILADPVSLRGDPVVLCEAPDGGSSCIASFPEIARRRLRVTYDVATGGSPRRVDETIVTLHADSGPTNGPGGDVLVESVRSEGTPPDRVTRAIRFESREGGVVRYHTDVTHDEVVVQVAGAGKPNLVTLDPPNPDAPRLIPILLDARPYLRRRAPDRDPEWQDTYAARVGELRDAIAVSAHTVANVSYLVVSYGADGRLIGPFRATDGAALEQLERVLLRPPAPRSGAADFGSIVHTLNDLYLRGFPGMVQLVWITDGFSAGGSSRFLPDLWPERIGQINAPWSDDEFAGVLEALDAGRGLQDAELVRFVASLPPDAPDRAGRILQYVEDSDRDATRTLHPHRVDTTPMMNCLWIPSDRTLRGERFEQFREFVEQRWGGDIVQYVRPGRAGSGTDADTLAGLLLRTAGQMAHTGRIELDVPNPKQNGARREIRVKVRRAGVRARLMPTYTASRPRSARLVDFLGSPFKSMRTLSAYEARFHPFDERLRAAASARWHAEPDPQVRAVLFESWVSIQLQRLQVEAHRTEAHERLEHAGEQADRLPDPALARAAADAARWYASGTAGNSHDRGRK